MKYISNSDNDTQNIAMDFAKTLNNSSVIVLTGDLGTGKTRFVQGVAKYFNLENKVCSPTFTIVNEYINNENNINIYHFDVYRLSDSTDFIESVGTEYFGKGICILEWGEQIKDILPASTIYVTITKDLDKGENYREIEIKEGEN